MPLISGSARVAGVVGWPVGHSRSPRLHNHWLARHGIDGAYVPLPVCPGKLPEALAGLRLAGLRGVNVTLPHKEAAFARCDRLDDSARRAGAANTLVFDEHGITGSNTDGAGFVANLLAHGVDPQAGPALLLGAGGAARAIACALGEAGAAVTLCNRTRERAEQLASALAQVGQAARVLDWDDRDAALADQALVVNTTSLGMNGQPPLRLALSKASSRLAVADIVYAPLETALLVEARARGLRAVEGLGMLLHQARAGFAAWFGVWPDVDAATRAVVEDAPPRPDAGAADASTSPRGPVAYGDVPGPHDAAGR